MRRSPPPFASFRFAALLAAALLAPSRALAQDSLYDPAPPADSAFVRVVNAGAEPLSADVGGRDFGRLEARAASPYRVVPKGTRRLRAGGADVPFDFRAGEFYTLAVFREGPPLLLKDSANLSRAKALVAVYNLTGDDVVDLKTADGAVAVVEKVPARAVKSRLVNGVPVDFAAYCAKAGPSAPLKSLQLERGGAYSLFVFAGAGRAEPVWLKNTTKTR